MKRFILISLLLNSASVFCQDKQCSCDKDTLMTKNTVTCDTALFSNDSKLYWQFNCDRIWLTFETPSGKRVVLNEVPVMFYGYAYRLGFQLIKEFKGSLLFRSACSASGPCVYTLIDKVNGMVLREFGQLICIDTDVQWEGSHSYNFEFIVYLSFDTKQLVVYFADDGRTIKIPFHETLGALIPERQFDEMSVDKNILTIGYNTSDHERKTLTIDLNEK